MRHEKKRVRKKNTHKASTAPIARLRTKKVRKRDGLRRRKQESENRKKTRRSSNVMWIQFLIAVTVMVGLSISIGSYFFSITSMEGYGMTPLIENGDQLVINKQEELKRFSLVSIHTTNSKETSIRRVIGLPGESIDYRQDTLFVDGQEIPERFLVAAKKEAKKEQRLLTDDFTVTDISGHQNGQVPKGSYLVLGDNRPYVSDSRFYGFVPHDQIVGIVHYRLLPLHKMSQFY